MNDATIMFTGYAAAIAARKNGLLAQVCDGPITARPQAVHAENAFGATQRFLPPDMNMVKRVADFGSSGATCAAAA